MKSSLYSKISEKVKILFKDEHVRDIAKWAAISFTIKIGAALFQFVFNVLLSQAIGAEEVGKYFLCFSVINMAVILGVLGLDKALMRFVPYFAAKKDWKSVRTVFNMGNKLGLVSGVLISIILFVLSDFLAGDILKRPLLGEYIRWFTLAVIPLVFLANLTEGFKGLKKIPTSLLLKSLLPCLAIIGVLLVVPKWGLKGMIWTYDATVIIMAIVGLVIWYFMNPMIKQESEPQEEEPVTLNKLLGSSMPLFGFSFFQQILIWAPTFLLGLWVADEYIGQFAIAQRISIITSLFLIAFNTILASKMGAFFANNQMKLLAKTTQQMTLMMSIAALPVFLILFIFSDYTMSLFGDDFTGGGILLKILLIGRFIGLVFGPVGMILIIGGEEKLTRNNMIFSAISLVVLCIILVPMMGIKGAAVALTTTVILNNIIGATLVYRKFKIITLPFMLLKGQS